MWIKHVLMDAAGDADGGTGAAGDKAADGGAAGAGAGADAGADKSIFADIGKGDAAAGGDAAAKGDAAKAGDDKALTPEARALQAADKDTRRPADVPAKYWDAEKGEVKYAAWAKSTSELESRMRDTGLPPKTADEYKFEVPEEMKKAGVSLDQATSKAFSARALALGLTQKQYEGVMGEYFNSLGTMANAAVGYSRDKLNAELLSHYKVPEELNKNVALAFRVVTAYGDESEVEAAMGPQGNTPAWVYRVLAKVGKEMGEDPGVQPDQVLGGDSLEHLMRGKAGDEDAPYWNPKHPQHAATVAKVTRFHQAQANARQRKAA